MLDAAYFVPQSRPRLFVVAKKAVTHKPVFLATPTATRPKALIDFILGADDLKWDVSPLPEPPRREARLVHILEDLPETDATWWPAARGKYFINQLHPAHVKKARAMIHASRFSYATAFRRIRNSKSVAELRTDGIAGCLRTPRGGSARQILFKAGRGKYWVRLLTARECARLQGVPDGSFKIDVPLNQALFGFGDAVCVPVIEWIAKNYLVPAAAELLRGKILYRPFVRLPREH
jgi:DNA (cytosine-5)-methyltransferase 1